MAVLLAQGDLQSVGVFLDCVEDPRTSAAALDALASVPNPPVETLFQFLHGPLVRRRTAAARALGQLNQAAISQALIAMALDGAYRHEAITALLSSSEPTARQFLADAARNPYLVAELWNAQRQLQSTPPRRS